MSEGYTSVFRRARSPLTWKFATVRLPCPVCGGVATEQVATARVPWQRGRVAIARCSTCNAVVLSDAQPATVTYDDAYVDRYVEQTAGIEAITGTLAQVSVEPGARMLDVGCGYGFGVDLGEQLHGWRGVGVDLSVAARRGHDDLGIDLRQGSLDDEIPPGDRFDVVLASELIEHVPDPHALVDALAERLADDGVLLLTTPDAAIVQRTTPEPTLLSALAIGDHRFLVDADGLRKLLEQHELHAVVRSSGPSLVALAWRGDGGRARVAPDGAVGLADLAAYCRRRAEAAPPGSALALGMAMRATKFSAYSGDFASTADALPALRDALLARYGIDLDDAPSLSALAAPPPILGPAGYFAGIVAAYVTGDLERADQLFAASAAAGRTHYETYRTYTDPEMARFEAQSLGERMIVAARRDRSAVPEALRTFDAAAVHTGLDAEALEEFHRRADELMANT
jgi:SAM-dependent methyltransferase